MEGPEDSRRGAPLEDIAELLGKRLTTSLVLAAGIIGLAIYARPAPPRYQIVASGAEVVRVDTRNGAMIACSRSGCTSLHRPGGSIVRIERSSGKQAVPPAAPQPQLPASAPAPASAQAPAAR